MMDELEGLKEWMEEDQKERFQDINKMIMRASNIEEMRDCLELVEGLYQEKVFEMRGEIEGLISNLYPHLMNLDPVICSRIFEMRKESEETREIYQLERMVKELKDI